MRLLQVCNVGRIVGGTAACAWSIARAFPDAVHHVAFLSSITDDTREVFSFATLHQCAQVTDAFVRSLDVDAVILHNTCAKRVERITSAWTLQYVHSKGPRAGADRTVYCSRWLAEQCRGAAVGRNDVLYQCVPRPVNRQADDGPGGRGSCRAVAGVGAPVLFDVPPARISGTQRQPVLARMAGASLINVGNLAPVAAEEDLRPPGERVRPLEDRWSPKRLVVGRLCTPTLMKWPMSLIAFYEDLAERRPEIDWEFVGCSRELMGALTDACRGQAVFHSAGWKARSHLARWDALLYHHPTLTESFGRTVAEAMRAGCLPIVDARGGFREQVTPETSWLCHSLDEFDEALGTLGDGPRRREMSGHARSWGDAMFSMSAFRTRMVDVWRNTVLDMSTLEAPTQSTPAAWKQPGCW